MLIKYFILNDVYCIPNTKINILDEVYLLCTKNSKLYPERHLITRINITFTTCKLIFINNKPNLKFLLCKDFLQKMYFY